MSEQQESVKKKTLKSSSRSFLFSTGLNCIKFSIMLGGNVVRLGQIRDSQLSLITNVPKVNVFKTSLSMVYKFYSCVIVQGFVAKSRLQGM